MRWLCFVSPPPHPWPGGPALSARPGPSSVSHQKLPSLFFHSFLGLFSAGSVNRTGSASGWVRSQMSVRGGAGAAGGRSGTASSAGTAMAPLASSSRHQHSALSRAARPPLPGGSELGHRQRRPRFCHRAGAGPAAAFPRQTVPRAACEPLSVFFYPVLGAGNRFLVDFLKTAFATSAKS